MVKTIVHMRYNVSVKHTRRRHVHYPISLGERLYVIVLGPLITIAVLALLLKLMGHAPFASALTWPKMVSATLATLGRLAVAYALSVVVAIPIALLIERNRTFETVLLPVFDVLESVPNLALLPVLVVFFGSFGFLDGAAITILFLNMVWTIVFALVGGLQVIPHEVINAGKIFGLRGWSMIRHLTLPAIFPQFVTGSILAVAAGWNVIIVAEALHAYVQGGTEAQDLFGIGSVLVETSARGQTGAYMLAFITMIAAIAALNFFVWQRLLHYSQRFRFE